MLVKNLKTIRYTSVCLCFAALFSLFAFPFLKGESATSDIEAVEKQMESLKSEIEKPNSSPALIKQYERLSFTLSNCSFVNQLAGANYFDKLAPTASLCINGALAVADPNYNRVLTTTSGTGVGTGVVGNCSLSGSGSAVEYDVYSFNVTGCAAFPTEITATLCGPAGCQHVGNVDTTLILYRNVAAGDPLTANGGLPGVFNPASACTNARAGSDDLGTTTGTQHNPGGATCNQVVTTQCLTPCTSPSNAAGLSGIRRQLGNGRFTLVVGGFGNGTTGAYNLYVDAPAAGCAIALAPTAANGDISGRVLTSAGQGIRSAAVTISGGSLPSPITKYSSAFGYYSFEGLPVGETYVVTVLAKRFSFDNPSQVINLTDNATDVDFISAAK
jgi:hypothetical protein